MPKNTKPIETIEEFEDALGRIKALDTGMPGSPDEDELKALRIAVEKWKRDHAEMPEAIKPRRD
jgi:hypothetical protein